ncbi:MAG: hypothetical protein KDD82_16285 [Planctomycetes bacterium]|nr:hypothetical protein [Planctomycetota bacterium]
MTAPSPTLPGQTYMLTRRTAFRKFFLLPSELVTQVFLYCLAASAPRFGLEVHAYCVLSNHYHLIVTDVRGNLPLFLHWFHVHVSKLLNLKYERAENLWSNEKTGKLALVSRVDVLDKIVYTIANPVSSGLVSRSERWPGPISLADKLAGSIRQCLRPGFLFRRKGPCPRKASLVLTKPPQFADMSDEAFNVLVARRVAEREEALRAKRRGEGKGFLGRRQLRRHSVEDTPSTAARGAKSRLAINPRVASKNKWLRIQAINSNRGFLEAHAAALEEWRSGNRDAVFPSGTWLMRVLHGVTCAPP